MGVPTSNATSVYSVADLQRVFFEPHWNDVVHGRSALRTRLTPALAELSSSVTCDELIDYDCGWTAALWTGEDTVQQLMARQNWDAG